MRLTEQLIGSSPRMRGTRVLASFLLVPGRFIPAHAGNSKRALRRAGFATGSSPRMRGTRERWHEKEAHGRFIPAHAGNSTIECDGTLVNAVHPRACGELLSTASTSDSGFGSSPRMRGTRNAVRLVPSVHPRACGELYIGDYQRDTSHGSSPRMRGTRNS